MTTPSDFIEPLRRLHDSIRGLVVAACEERTTDELTIVSHEGAGDVIYAIDRVSETELVDRFTREIAANEPIVLIGEGLPNGRITLPEGSTERDARWRIIVDPIDGTRGLMYQKRPGWILTGIAPNLGENTTLADIEVAIQTEIPLVKQHLCDQVWAVRGGGVHGVRHNRLTGESRTLTVQPSRATELRHGFATICRFFPGGRDVLAALDEDLCDRILSRQHGEVGVFEDQYACTGGQLFGLAIGQDRLVADLRPLVQRFVEERHRAGPLLPPLRLMHKAHRRRVGRDRDDANRRYAGCTARHGDQRCLGWLCKPAIAIAHRAGPSRLTAGVRTCR